ncbi:MAG: TatD family hydrolase [Actinomycetota bacterium]|nr:TatD family hydrolase [Actinomycetota bacterium]
MVDTHSHIGLRDDNVGAIVARAAVAGVEPILTVGLEEESNRRAIALAGEHDAIFACVGRHPNSATGWDDAARADLRALSEEPGVVAVGETGLDYFRDGAPRSDQLRAFRDQIAIAREVAKPLVIHMRSGDGPDRDAVAECFDFLGGEAEGVAVILHCFSAPAERVADAARHGWFCSFAGNATYPKAQALRDAAKLVPDELILVETDSPYLAPQSRRGKPNEPAFVVETAREIAAARGETYAELERLVSANAERAFQWHG